MKQIKTNKGERKEGISRQNTKRNSSKERKKKKVEGTKEIHNRENEERTPTVLLHLAALPQ